MKARKNRRLCSTLAMGSGPCRVCPRYRARSDRHPHKSSCRATRCASLRGCGRIGRCRGDPLRRHRSTRCGVLALRSVFRGDSSGSAGLGGRGREQSHTHGLRRWSCRQRAHRSYVGHLPTDRVAVRTGAGEPEPVGIANVVSTVLELAVVVGTLLLLRGNELRRSWELRFVRPVIAIATIAITTLAFAGLAGL